MGPYWANSCNSNSESDKHIMRFKNFKTHNIPWDINKLDCFIKEILNHLIVEAVFCVNSFLCLSIIKIK